MLRNLSKESRFPKCNTLQHTATHCNTLHHHRMSKELYNMSKEPRTLSRESRFSNCNTLQHTATHCISITCQKRYITC